MVPAIVWRETLREDGAHSLQRGFPRNVHIIALL